MRISDWSSDVCSSDLGGLFSSKLLDGIGRTRRKDSTFRANGIFPTFTWPISRCGLRSSPTKQTAVSRMFSRSSAKRRKRPGSLHMDHHPQGNAIRSEEHTSELQSLMRSSYAVFCLKKKNTNTDQ